MATKIRNVDAAEDLTSGSLRATLPGPVLPRNSRHSLTMIRPHHCPVCDAEFEPTAEIPKSLFPFCSDRCRSIDLLRWFDGRYKVVEDIDPQAAQILQHDPNIKVQDEPD